MKRLSLALLAITLATTLLAGCSSTDSSQTETTTPTQPSESAQNNTEQSQFPDEVTVLKYAHMNTTDNTAGIFAQCFADEVYERSEGSIQIEMYPNSTLGSISEMAEMVKAGTIDITHGTWGGFSPIDEKLELLDTPYLIKNIDDGMKLYDVYNSPVLIDINETLIEETGVRVLYSIYGGTRLLTCTDPIYSPSELSTYKIRAIPSPIFITAVEGMGAIAVAVDWADVPTALATGVVHGQENVPTSIYTSKLYETQGYLMDTKHSIGFGPTVMNESTFQSLTAAQQEVIIEVSKEMFTEYSQVSREAEEELITQLQSDECKMVYITQEDGLQYDEFKAGVDALVAKNFPQFADRYAEINEFLGY